MKKVCAYCRVSTDKDDQTNSLENQKRFFESYINRNHEWELVNIYVDEGISGTSVKRRKAFNQMIEDAENKAFDMILTKEISRFARNTLDSIYYTRKLKELGIGVIFMTDNINTLDADSELRLTIMSSIAQEESRKISERVKWGQKRQMEKGVVFGNRIFGYIIKNGKISVNPKEAEIVRLIFDLYLNENMGLYTLCKELQTRGIPTPSGKITWNNPSLHAILKNEKYIGILKQKKSITTDFLNHRRKVNDNDDYIIIENNHEPIIDKQTFDNVQLELERRRSYKPEKSKYSSRHVWSGKLECAYCKSKFRRRKNNRKSPKPQFIWQCTTGVIYGKQKEVQGQLIGCNCKFVHENYLEKMLIDVINNLAFNKDNVTSAVKAALKEVIQNDDTDISSDILKDIEKIEKKKKKLIDLFYEDGITKAEFKKLNDENNRQIEILQNKLDDIKKSSEEINKLQDIFETVENIMDGFVSGITFCDEIAKQFLNKIVVHDREKFDVYINARGKYPLNFIYPFR